jgi:hypothetical protein
MSDIDTTPTAIREASRRADAMIAAIAAEAQKAKQVPAQPPAQPAEKARPPVEMVVSETPPADFSQNAPQQPPEGAAPDQPQPFAPQPPALPPAPQAETLQPPASEPPAPQPSASDLEVQIAELRERLARAEQESRTWKGRFEAELPREREQRKALESAKRELEQKLQELEQAQAQAKFNIEPVTEEEESLFGADLLLAAARKTMPLVKEYVAVALAPYEKRLADLTSVVESLIQDTAANRKRRFFADLLARVPEAKELDTDPGFHAWLQEYDPFLGRVRQEALDNATAVLDVERTAAFFKAYLGHRNASESRSSDASAQVAESGTARTAPVSQSASGLEAFAAPPASRAAPVPDPNGNPRKLWPVSEIKAFYRALANGTFRGTREQRSAIEAEIAAAQREGRVTPN